MRNSIRACSTVMYTVFRLVMNQNHDLRIPVIYREPRPSDKPRGADIVLHSELGRFTRPFSTIPSVISSLYPHTTTFTLGPPLTIWYKNPFSQRKSSFLPVTMSPCCALGWEGGLVRLRSNCGVWGIQRRGLQLIHKSFIWLTGDCVSARLRSTITST